MKNCNQYKLWNKSSHPLKDNNVTQHGPLEDNEEKRIEEGEEVDEVDMQHIAQEDEQVSSNHETVSDTFAEGSSNISDWKTDPGNVSPSACTSKCYGYFWAEFTTAPVFTENYSVTQKLRRNWELQRVARTKDLRWVRPLWGCVIIFSWL